MSLSKDLENLKYVKDIFSQLAAGSQHFEILEDFVSCMGENKTIDDTEEYILCFTEEKDQLSQWRGYGRGRESVCRKNSGLFGKLI